MTMKIYKHWKKMALVLTSFFWASCGDDSSSTAPITTSAESSSAIQSSSSVGPTSSSGAAPESSSEAAPKSSSEVAPESSSATPTSSSGEKIACEEATLLRTGPSEPCIEDICPEYGVPLYEISGLKCEDGKEYELESICPDYGIDLPCTNTYIGEDGKRLSEEEFKEIYRMAKPEGESSSSAKIVEESSSSTGPKIVPLYGVEMPAENQDIN